MSAPPDLPGGMLPDLPGVTHEFIDAGGLRTHVALAGSEQSPPVLLVHGWPQHWWAWRHVIPELAQTHRVIAADLRGHGWTDRPRGGYIKDQLAADLLAALDTLGIERVTWIGHDWGAYAGFLAALRHPERIERMLTLAIPHLWTRRDPRLLPVLLSYQGPLSLPMIGPRVADRMLRRILQAGRGPDRLSQADVDLFAEHVPPSTSVAMYRTFLTKELPRTLRGRFADQTLVVPTTHMVGERDLVTTGAVAGPSARQPRLHVEVIPTIAHWIPEQRPDVVIDWARRPGG